MKDQGAWKIGCLGEESSVYAVEHHRDQDSRTGREQERWKGKMRDGPNEVVGERVNHLIAAACYMPQA